ncbi:MAG: TonB-dependent receptor [Candidatus Sulfotelmatobacter sp.]
MRGKLLLLVCLFVLLALASYSIAQTASINGTVSDSTGALIEHAKVSVRNTTTNATREVFSGAGGAYSVSELPAGPYELTVEKDGFRSVQFRALNLTVAQNLTVNAKLEVGASAEQITVEGAVVPIDTTDAELSNVVEHTQMTELPLILRDPYQLVLLAPGTMQSDSDLAGFSINGGRERNNNFMLDGADNNDTEVPGSYSGLTAQNPDSTQEFRVITNNFAPEFGRNNGAVIDVITRSGGNQFHGDAFYFGRWDALGARDYFNHYTAGTLQPKNPYIRNIYGGSFGGPIVKDRTFFFLNYQGKRFITNLTNNSTVPTSAFESGIFTYTNPSTGATQALNVTTQNSGNNATGVGLDPVMQKIFGIYNSAIGTLPTAPTGDGITSTLFFPSESREKDEDATLKIDQKITDRHNLSARFIYGWYHDPNSGHYDFLPGDIGATAAFDRTSGLALNLTSNFTNTIVNELRLSANRTNQGYTCTGVGLFDSLGFADQVGRGADFSLPVLNGNGLGFGCQVLGDADGQGRKSGTYQYGDNLTKVINQHTLKFGGEFRDVYSNNFTDFFSRANFTFNIYSQDGIAPLQGLQTGIDNIELEDITSALLGLVNSQSQTQFFSKTSAREANDELDFRQREGGVFAQDEWKVLPNLSLTYGLRWEYYGVPFEAQGNLSNLFQDASGPAPALAGGGNGFTFVPVGPGTGQQLYASYHNDSEPRFGFAWDPYRNGKNSIRGGIGVFSDRVYGNLVSDARGNPPFQPSLYNAVASTFGPTSDAQLQNQPAPSQLVPSPVVTNLDPSTFLGGLTFPDIFANNIKPPEVVSWNFGVQHEIAPKLTLEMNYVGNHGTRILRVVDGNAPQPNIVNNLVNYCSDPTNIYGCSNSTLQYNALYYGAEIGALPFDAVNNNAFLHTFTDQTSGHSWYNGLQAQVTERAFHGLQAQLSYTWAHAMDDSSDPLVTTTGNGNYPIDSYALYREKGNSGFDVRQRAVMNFVYQPRIGRGTGFLNHGLAGRVFEGWEIGGIAQWQTGTPYDIFAPLDTLHTGFSDRATVVNAAALKQIPSTGKISSNGGVFTGFNVAAFNPEDGSIPIPFGIPSNTVRNNWYGPGVNRWDVNFAKTTSLTENVKLQLRFEFYNLFNRTWFSKPDYYLADAAIGTFSYSTSTVTLPDYTTSARQIQIAAKLTF